jgi:hypothetical protein
MRILSMSAVTCLTAAFSPLPKWSFSWVDQEGYGHPGSYTVPASNGFHPPMTQSVQGLAVERRWNNTRALHPFVAVSAGSITNSFDYIYYAGDSSRTTAPKEVDVVPRAGCGVVS